VYDVKGDKGCYGFAVTRGESSDCRALGPNGTCHVATSSLVLNRNILNVINMTVNRIEARHKRTVHHWHAVHINTWACEPGAGHLPTGRPTVAKFREDVLDVVYDRVVRQLNHSVDTDGVFLLSQLRGEEYEKAALEVFPTFLWKTDILPDILSRCDALCVCVCVVVVCVCGGGGGLASFEVGPVRCTTKCDVT
jgi:hypothetical protein